MRLSACSDSHLAKTPCDGCQLDPAGIETSAGRRLSHVVQDARPNTVTTRRIDKRPPIPLRHVRHGKIIVGIAAGRGAHLRAALGIASQRSHLLGDASDLAVAHRYAYGDVVGELGEPPHVAHDQRPSADERPDRDARGLPHRRVAQADADVAGRDQVPEPVLLDVRQSDHAARVRLLDLGEDPGDLDTEALRDWIGLGTHDEMRVTKAEFLRDRTRRFGKGNPEQMDIPFWRAMVRNGWCGYQAARHFGEESYDHDAPVWCHHRFGMSLTPLPDGRWIQIAGEHEDHYDPDFCIYNDVIIHDGKGGFEILGYPEEIFPPTDFHSATLVGEWIYIIGNLGYPHTREAFGYQTPVFRFHTGSGEIERVATSGESPGWIHDHQAKLDHGTIRVFQGKVLTVDGDGETDITGLRGSFALDLATGIWTKR